LQSMATPALHGHLEQPSDADSVGLFTVLQPLSCWRNFAGTLMGNRLRLPNRPSICNFQ
jgi:hypothetical protein